MNILIALIFVISTTYANEVRKKIVVIDTGIGWHQLDAPFLCKDGVLSVVDKHGLDDNNHGLNIIGIISKKMDHSKFCITSIKYHSPQSKDTLVDFVRALALAYKQTNVAFLNLSVDGSSYHRHEESYYRAFIKRGTYIVVAAGNHNMNLTTSCNEFPACMKKDIKHNLFKVVGGKDMEGSNYGNIVTHIRPAVKQGFPKMTGTSQATANLTGELAR